MLFCLSNVCVVLPKPLRPVFITLRLTGLLPLGVAWNDVTEPQDDTEVKGAVQVTPIKFSQAYPNACAIV